MTLTASAFSDGRQFATVQASCRPPSFAQLDGPDPQRIEPDGTPTWIMRGANFVVAVSRVKAGAEIIQDVPDESMLLLSPAVPVTIEAGGVSEEVGEEALVILPPGRSRIDARDAGLVVRILSNAAAEIAGLAKNAAAYEGPLDDVAPLEYWPAPVGGFRLRIYLLRDHSENVGFGRIFRCTNLMVNIFAPTEAPRDRSRLSPHEHADFEQGSLTIEGDFTHYLRTPWGPDSRLWRDDQIITCSGCSLVVIPPRMIHTTGWSTAGARLVDVFSPPREDFSLKPRWIRNAADYPLPARLAVPDKRSLP
jgi:hypothetical protein